MRDPDDRKRDSQRPSLPGGKARERLRMFTEARGITEQTSVQTITRWASDYSAAVLQAIAAAEAAGPGQANQPQWRFLGPDLMANGQAGTATVPSRVTVSGRVSSVAVDPRNPNHLLCCSAAGGIWESFTRGADWAPRTDFMTTLTTGAIAFDPSNPSTVYAGTGEGNSYWYFGQGMLRSADGGTTWALLTDKPFIGQGFFAIIVDPANGQHLLAATQGLAAVPATPATATTPATAAIAATGGVYQSADGGRTWTQPYADTACWDISMQSGGGAAAEVLAATTGGLFRSADGGTTWNAQALPGAPASLDRLAVSISPADSTVAYAFGASGSTPYIWRRSGGTWSALVTPKQSDGKTELIDTSQASYDWYAEAAPDNAGQVYLGAKDVFRGDLSADGTTWTWTCLTTKNPGDSIHPDQHAIAFDLANPGTIYCGNDGGLFRSPDRGTTWVSLNPGLGITELEYMVDDNLNSRWLLAGTQDNGSIRYLGTSAFEHVADGDGGDCGIDQTRGNPATSVTCYHTYYYMTMERSTTGGGWGSWTLITPPVPSPLPSGYCLFYPPVAVSGRTVAIAGKTVWISRDTGTTWREVALPGINQYVTALYLASTDLAYVATLSGYIFTITFANGAWTATRLTRPRASYVSAIRLDQSNRIWVTLTEIGDGTPGNGQVWRSDDNGKTWIARSAGLPNLPVTSVEFDRATPDRVWISADVGVYQSLDAGTTWTPFFQNLPYVIVEDLEFHPGNRVLRAATRSRGIWEAAVDTAGTSAMPPPAQVCAVTMQARGGLEAFAVATDKTLMNIYQDVNSGPWSSWAPLIGTNFGPMVTGSLTSAPVVAQNQDGRLEVFARGADGTLYHTYQTTAPGPWTAWASLGGFLTGNPAVARNQDGRLEVFARGQDGALWHLSQSTAGAATWSPWASLSGVMSSAPAVIADSDGLLQVFSRGTDGALTRIRQLPAGSASSWSGWDSLGGYLTSNPAPGRNQDGRLEVFARGGDGLLKHAYQTAAGNAGAWSAWDDSLGGALTLAGGPAVASNTDGRLEVFARGIDGTPWHIYQGQPNTAWSQWSSLGGIIDNDPAVAVAQDGRLAVFGRGTDGALWYIIQAAAASSGWSGWTSLGGTLLRFT